MSYVFKWLSSPIPFFQGSELDSDPEKAGRGGKIDMMNLQEVHIGY